jgi:hypothetical protein
VGTVIPVLADFITALTFDGGELVDVAYEPSENTDRWEDYRHRAEEVRALRAVAAATSQQGRFRLQGTEAADVTRKMRYAKGIDPSLAVYVAYAYHDLQAIGKIRDISDHLRADLGVTLFDVALLARFLIDQRITLSTSVVPFVPLLGRAWAIVAANRVKLHPALKGIEGMVRNSLWTLYSPPGIKRLQEALHAGDVQ